MKRRLLPLILASFVLASQYISAQTAGRRAIVWSGDANCGFKTKSIMPDEETLCASFTTPRGGVSAIRHNAVSLAVAFLEEGDYLIVGVHLKNLSNVPIDFDTDLWGAAHFAMREGTIGTEKPLLAETAIPSREIMRGISSGVSGQNATDMFLSGTTKKIEVREIRRPDGTRVRHDVVVDDQDARREAVERGEIRHGLATKKQAEIRKSAMTLKWLPALGTTRGLVYFRRVKSAALVIFSFKILDTTYVFRLPRKPS